jgi:glycosyltransferase involved in cell wall biosynthesis
MRIGIDARELCGRATGVGRYLGGLLEEWAHDEGARRHEFLLYAPEATGLTLDARRFPTRHVPGPGGWQWEQVRVPPVARQDHIDVWFAPAYTAPLRLDIPVVVAIHDLSFVAHPEWFRVKEGMRRRWITRQSAKAARAVVTISEFSKRELIERLNVPPRRVHVIPPGIGAGGLVAGRLGASETANVPKEAAALPSPQPPATSLPNVLYVGSIFNRRHVPDLVRAFAAIARAHPDATLDIVGDNRSYPREDLRRTIETEGLQAIVQWHEYVSDEQLRDLYARARAFAFLSEYEGLGLTPLEALAAGVPPVLLDTPVARESCGDAALYVGPGDGHAITAVLERALFSEPARAAILAAAPRVLARYQWSRAAADTLALLESPLP